MEKMTIRPHINEGLYKDVKSILTMLSLLQSANIEQIPVFQNNS